MSIAVGERIPSVTLNIMGANGPEKIDSHTLLGQGKVVLFAVPGAFTPTCSQAHLPGYVVYCDALRAKGVERIVCIAVNDAFVMDAWGKTQNAEGQVIMAADGNGEFTKALGLEMDASGFGMGVRSQRYAMVLQDGVVQILNIEPPRTFELSKAETILAALSG